MLRAAPQEALKEGMSLDSLRRLSGGDKVVLAGTLGVLVSIFLPWWNDGLGNGANGLHDWGWLTVASVLLVLALFTTRRLLDEQRRMPELSVGDGVAYILGGSAELLGAVVFWLVNNSRIVGTVQYGVFVAVVGGAVTIAGGYLRQVERSTPNGPAGDGGHPAL